MLFICQAFSEADMKMKYLPILIISFGLIFLGCGSKKTEAKVEFPKTIPGKVVFSTSRSQAPYSLALYEENKIKIIKEEGGLLPKLSPSGSKALVNAVGGIDIFDLMTNEKIKIPPPESKIKTIYEQFQSDQRILAISQNALGVREKIPYDLYRYDLLEKRWTKLTNFKPDEGILGFDIFKDGKHILCSYSSDYKTKGGGNRGTYIMDLETGTMKKITDWGGQYKIMPDQKSFLVQRGIWKNNKLVSYSEITFFDIETKKERILTHDGNPKSAPTVSADGRWALYSVSTGGQERIFMLHIPTGATKEMFDRPIAYAGEVAHDRNPDWVP